MIECPNDARYAGGSSVWLHVQVGPCALGVGLEKDLGKSRTLFTSFTRPNFDKHTSQPIAPLSHKGGRGVRGRDVNLNVCSLSAWRLTIPIPNPLLQCAPSQPLHRTPVRIVIRSSSLFGGAGT